jgi:hypothetical protein
MAMKTPIRVRIRRNAMPPRLNMRNVLLDFENEYSIDAIKTMKLIKIIPVAYINDSKN